MKFKISITVSLLLVFCCSNIIGIKLEFEAKHKTVLDLFNSLYSKKNPSETKKHKNKLKVKPRHRKVETISEFQKQSYRFLEASQSAGATNSTAPANSLYEGWLSISSYDFLNAKAFPTVFLPELNQKDDIQVDNNRFRINKVKTTDPQKPNLDFYFRMNKDHIFYSSTPEDINILGAIDLEQAKTIQRNKIEENCIDIEMISRTEFKICSNDFTTRDKWYCEIAKRKNIIDQFCEANTAADFKVTFNVDQKVYQPIILVAEASLQCNENFSYQMKGADWECGCSEGKEQSPINIDSKKVFKSPATPVFNFDDIEAISPITSLEGSMIANEHIKIRYFKNAIRIFHTKLGKIVTLDGTVYHAEEIVFHSPAEHTLDGIRHEMEVQVIGYGQSKGDIAKQVVLSFIFMKKPGIYNKFIDDVDFFNLPTKDVPEKNIVNNINLNKILFSSDSEEIVAMRPFSLYTYQGSITFPPCTENTIHYVAADPIPIGHAMITMLKEALRESDSQSTEEIANARELQALNGRTVFFYDASKCKTPSYSIPQPKEVGHYEKIKKKVSQFFFVNGEEPSGIPDTFVVTENEAKGLPDEKTGFNQ